MDPQQTQNQTPPKQISNITAWFFIVFIIAGVASWVAINYRTEFELEASRVVIQPIHQSNWKTYRNEKYGFEFKYPSNWVLNDKWQNDPDLITTISAPTTITTCYEGCGPDIEFYYYLSILEASRHDGVSSVPKNIDEYVNNKDTSLTKPKEVIFAGNKAFEVTRYSYSSYFSIIIQDKNALYEILFGNLGAKKDLNNIENQILSTFKFISTSTVDTSSWKTYRDEKYGFEFNYPSSWGVDIDSHGMKSKGGQGGIDLYKDYLPGTYRQPENMTGYCKIGIVLFDENFTKFSKNVLSDNYFVESSTTLVVAGLKGIRIVTDEAATEESVYLPFSATEILSIEMLCGGDVWDNGEKVLDQILSTFKFTK